MRTSVFMSAPSATAVSHRYWRVNEDWRCTSSTSKISMRMSIFMSAPTEIATAGDDGAPTAFAREGDGRAKDQHGCEDGEDNLSHVSTHAFLCQHPLLPQSATTLQLAPSHAKAAGAPKTSATARMVRISFLISARTAIGGVSVGGGRGQREIDHFNRRTQADDDEQGS
jgi:hypothetical protein